jgi:hypothetical protein
VYVFKVKDVSLLSDFIAPLVRNGNIMSKSVMINMDHGFFDAEFCLVFLGHGTSARLRKQVMMAISI